MSIKPAITIIGILCLTVTTVSKLSAQNDSAFAKVYFMRLPVEEERGLLEMALNYCNVFIDSVFICKLDERKYFTNLVPAGTHRFDMRLSGKKIKKQSESAFASKSATTTFKVEAGKSYYIQLVFRRYGGGPDVYCKILTEERANMMLPDLKEDKSCAKMNVLKE